MRTAPTRSATVLLAVAVAFALGACDEPAPPTYNPSNIVVPTPTLADAPDGFATKNHSGATSRHWASVVVPEGFESAPLPDAEPQDASIASYSSLNGELVALVYGEFSNTDELNYLSPLKSKDKDEGSYYSALQSKMDPQTSVRTDSTFNSTHASADYVMHVSIQGKDKDHPVPYALMTYLRKTQPSDTHDIILESIITGSSTTGSDQPEATTKDTP